MCDSTDMQALCKNLWDNYFERRLSEALRASIGYYKAQVVRVNASAKTADVQRPFDTDTITVPCAASATSGLSAGEMCIVLTFGDLSNSVVLCKADFSTI